MTVYRTVVVQALSEIADRAYQEKVWLASAGPEVGSLVEAVSQLFDDSGLADALGKRTVFSVEVDEMLVNLDRRLAPLIKSNRDPLEVLGDPRLAAIRELAAQALFAIVRLA
jgi:hypothetical protein